GAKNDWEVGIHVLNCPDEMNDSFLTRDSTNEEQKRRFCADSAADQRSGCLHRPIFLEIDPVMDHVHALWIDIEQTFDVAYRCSDAARRKRIGAVLDK